MQNEDYRYLYELEDSFWWFAGMRQITASLLDPYLHAAEPKPILPKRILDAGCGTGGNLKWLRKYADSGDITGLDFERDALQFCRQNYHPRLVQATATHLPFASESFDLVTSFDVLVQIPGEAADESAMREMFRVLRPGGFAFVRCAAYEWMRSGHDEALSTQRRYHLRQLAARLHSAGFMVHRATYANTLLFPVAALRRLICKRLGLADSGSDVKPLAPHLQWLNALLKIPLLLEAYLLRHSINLPFGLSAICIVQKPDSR
jgi:SAM-dependent methyltransferase